MVGRQNKFVNTLMFKMLGGSRDFPIVVTNSGKKIFMECGCRESIAFSFIVPSNKNVISLYLKIYNRADNDL